MTDSDWRRLASEFTCLQAPWLRAERVRLLNDLFRITGLGGRQLFTPGVRAMGLTAVVHLRLRIAEFDAFTPDNDPYGEHDFGSLEFGDATVFWKIDYFDASPSAASPDPADPSVTMRLLTIMLASEY